jgi:transglutaminase-like putative cysteine protease
MLSYKPAEKEFLILRADLKLICILLILIFCPLNLVAQKNKSSDHPKLKESTSPGIIYRNPRVYNVDYTFELCPEQNNIDRSKDLKLWIPVPREWDSQKAVKIISVDPKPYSTYKDPEHGNKMLYWDFGKKPIKTSYQVSIQYRFEAFETHAEVTADNIGVYDKTSEEYNLYTGSSRIVHITPQIKEMAKEAISNETNPYRQAALIFNFVSRKVRYYQHRMERGVGTDVLLNFPLKDNDSGENYYEGGCDQYHSLFVALCRAVGIPARPVAGFLMGASWVKEKDLQPFLQIETELSPEGLAGTQHLIQSKDAMMAMPHVWAEFYLPSCGWVPVDLNIGRTFGYLMVARLIMSKGFDVLIGPNINKTDNEGYGFQWALIDAGRVDLMQSGVWNIAKIRSGKVKILHHPDPFPADGYFQYAENLYPLNESEVKLRKWREEVLATFKKVEQQMISKNIFKINPDLKTMREAYLCDLLRRIVGDEKFKRIFETYLNLRLTSRKPIPTEKFRKIAEQIYRASLDFYFREWINNDSLPQFGQNKYRAPAK